MGVIQIITPKSSVLAKEPLSRTKQVILAKDFAAKAYVQVYRNNGVVRYSKITAQNITYESDTTASFLRKIDILWLYGKCNNLSLPGWNGYIERLASNSIDFSISRILFLPFIPQPASVYNTIYTSLLCALENAKRYGHDVTFDQPLYREAREIVAAAPEGSDLSKIVIRLGGFHLLSSFFGAIGYIMQGSGIKEDMLQSENLIDPSVFRRFMQRFLTVRRSAKFSCGASTDMIIKQSLMKSMQTARGIARGRKVFTNSGSSPDIIFTNGTRFLLAMYGAPNKIDSIDKYRYLSFVKNTRNNKRVKLSCLPPTSAAAYQHLCRVYYQVQVCLCNELDPENWGWILKDNSLEPIQTLLPPPPEKLLNTIFCNCKKGCNYKCGCKKVGLFCSQVCNNCPDKSYSNVESSTTDEDAYDINEEISDSSFFLREIYRNSATRGRRRKRRITYHC
ncbi:hypothetical protein AVEN_170161-1 [Araneus ventricosus]|uniref:Tesmin/TSO1-like CXC domain-containing protein n=1 Tax=Araneus ventricosus TaxID=182803 RepID=A0A4Y2NR96_ARAVE|nr:hypothetical protein AVEN_170161-1 [Araneus ventricosus]